MATTNIGAVNTAITTIQKPTRAAASAEPSTATLAGIVTRRRRERVMSRRGMPIRSRATWSSRRSITAAVWVIAFIVSFDEAVISLFIAESGLPTLPVHVLRYVEQSADAAVAALSVVLIAISLVVVVIVERVMGLRRAL